MRIQILNLPDELFDGELHGRFVLVLDGHPNAGGPLGKKLGKKFDRFARSVGAAGGLVSHAPVEIEDGGTASAELVAQVVKQLDELISKRLDEHQAARKQTWTFTQPATVTNPTVAQLLRELNARGRQGAPTT